MKIFTYRGRTDLILNIADNERIKAIGEKFSCIHGPPLGAKIAHIYNKLPPSLRIDIPDYVKSYNPFPDMISANHHFVISQKVCEILKTDLGIFFEEITPILPEGYDHYKAFWLTHTIENALNIRKTKYRITFSDGRIGGINSYYFNKENIPERCFFTDKNYRAQFVTEPIVKDILKAGLTGFEFDLLWDSDGKYPFPPQYKIDLTF